MNYYMDDELNYRYDEPNYGQVINFIPKKMYINKINNIIKKYMEIEDDSIFPEDSGK